MEKLKLNKLKTWLFKWPLWIGLLCGVTLLVFLLPLLTHKLLGWPKGESK
jgi:hypothetical protein